MTYAEKLKDPRWQKKRLEIFQRDNFTCINCGSIENTLHIHHKKYIFGVNPWEYPSCDLETLCFICHGNKHDKIPEKSPERHLSYYLLNNPEDELVVIINKILILQERLKNGNENEVAILKEIMELNNQKIKANTKNITVLPI